MPKLIIRCKEKVLDAYMVTGMAAAGDATPVTYRLDKQAAVKSTWGNATSSDSIFFRPPVGDTVVDFVEQLSKAETFLIELTPYNSTPTMTRFIVKSLVEALPPLQDACKGEWEDRDFLGTGLPGIQWKTTQKDFLARWSFLKPQEVAPKSSFHVDVKCYSATGMKLRPDLQPVNVSTCFYKDQLYRIEIQCPKCSITRDAWQSLLGKDLGAFKPYKENSCAWKHARSVGMLFESEYFSNVMLRFLPISALEPKE